MPAKPLRHTLLAKKDKAAIAAVEKLVAEAVELQSKPTDADLERREERLNNIKAVIEQADNYFEKSVKDLHRLHDKVVGFGRFENA
jgi:hypothetical protein